MARGSVHNIAPRKLGLLIYLEVEVWCSNISTCDQKHDKDKPEDKPHYVKNPEIKWRQLGPKFRPPSQTLLDM